MMAIRPGWIKKEEYFQSEKIHLSEKLRNIYINSVSLGKGTVRVLRNVDAVSPNGAFGEEDDDPREASSEFGEKMIDGVAEFLKDFIDAFKEVPLP